MSKRPLFRDINERIRALNASFGILDGTYAVLCECHDSGCVERFEINADVHADICSRDDCFLVSTTHEAAPDGERVVARGETYVVVETSALVA